MASSRAWLVAMLALALVAMAAVPIFAQVRRFPR